jgi:hypothetical protein
MREPAARKKPLGILVMLNTPIMMNVCHAAAAQTAASKTATAAFFIFLTFICASYAEPQTKLKQGRAPLEARPYFSFNQTNHDNLDDISSRSPSVLSRRNRVHIRCPG